MADDAPTPAADPSTPSAAVAPIRAALDSQPTIALIIVIAFIGLVLVWMLHPPTGDAASLSLLNALVMVVGTAFLTVVNNYFSSTRTSQSKDETIRKLATTAETKP